MIGTFADWIDFRLVFSDSVRDLGDSIDSPRNG